MKTNEDPIWEAKLAEVVQNHKDGDLITHDEINDILGLCEPDFNDYADAGEYKEALKKYEFVRLHAVESLKNDLLEGHKVYLNNVQGQGYRIVPPAEQTSVAYTKHVRNIGKEFTDGQRAMNNVRQTALNAEEKAAAANLHAKFAFLEQIFHNNK